MNEKPIVMTVTINPLKGTKRAVMVSAAPQGEMPIVLSGHFPQLHDLINQAFGQIVKRDPQVVTAKEAKPTSKTIAAKAKSSGVLADTPEGTEETGDHLVSETETSEGTEEIAAPISAITEPEDLPEIEGDETTEDSDE